MLLVKTLLESAIYRALAGQDVRLDEAPQTQSWVCREFPEIGSTYPLPLARTHPPLIAECCDPDAALVRVRDMMVVDGGVVSLGGDHTAHFIFEA